MGVHPLAGIRDRSRLSPSQISATTETILQQMQSDLVQNHHFLVRVAISQANDDVHASVAVVPSDDRGTGLLVDVLWLYFFDRFASLYDIRSRLDEWG